MHRIFNSIKNMFFSKKNNNTEEDTPTNLDKAIVQAAKIGDQKTIEELVLNNQAIQAASTNGHLRVVPFYLQDPRDNRDNTLQEASYHGHLDVVERLLLDARVDRLSKDPRVTRLEVLQKKTIHELRRMMHKEKMTDMDVKRMKKAEMIDYLKHIAYQSL